GRSSSPTFPGSPSSGRSSGRSDGSLERRLEAPEQLPRRAFGDRRLPKLVIEPVHPIIKIPACFDDAPRARRQLRQPQLVVVPFPIGVPPQPALGRLALR